MMNIIGIDFGTSTNYVARWDSNRNRPVSLPIFSAERGESGDSDICENVIFYESETNQVLGRIALERGFLYPEKMVCGIKRKLQRGDKNIPVLGKRMTSEEVARDIFRVIRTKVENSLGGTPVDSAVISVPYAFMHHERQRIRYAAERAGLSVIGLIEEPVAAILACGFEPSTEEENVLIFDIGGGTLDITVFKYTSQHEETRVEVLNTEGRSNLGGTDIDDYIMDEMLMPILKYKPIDILEPAGRTKEQHKLRMWAKEIKEGLTTTRSFETERYDLYNNSHLECEPTVEELNNILGNFVAKIKLTLDDALEDSELEVNQIDRIIMVGGTSRIPLIKKFLNDYFGKEPVTARDPLRAIGNGAVIYCADLCNVDTKFTLVKKLSQSVGLKINDRFTELLKKNTHYDTLSSSIKIPLSSRISVYQGDPVNYSLIGNFDVEQHNITAGSPVYVKLGINSNGIVHYELHDATRLIQSGELS